MMINYDFIRSTDLKAFCIFADSGQQIKTGGNEYNSPGFKDVLDVATDLIADRRGKEKNFKTKLSSDPLKAKSSREEVPQRKKTTLPSEECTNNGNNDSNSKKRIDPQNTKTEDDMQNKESREQSLKKKLAKTLGITEGELGVLLAALNIPHLRNDEELKAFAQEISEYLDSGDFESISDVLRSLDGGYERIKDILKTPNLEGMESEIAREQDGAGLKTMYIDDETPAESDVPLERTADMSSWELLEGNDKIMRLEHDIYGNDTHIPEDFSTAVFEDGETQHPASSSLEDSYAQKASKASSPKNGIAFETLEDGEKTEIKSERFYEHLGANPQEFMTRVEQENDLLQAIQESIPTSEKEVLSQVIEKARVLLDGDKNEMLINLKPDHLGKLALKIITEKGIVAAKFIAENEQVKAVLESNLDLLKESLQKQGFSIREFSVSVGDNGAGTKENKNMHHNNSNKSKSRDKAITAAAANVFELGRMNEAIDPYGKMTGSINIIA
ncbi:MAG: flagellar hook-length control protein FliK [Clostridium sp.]|nr:flagellar hook-length control protein FliK [Clostridium sp.]